MKSAVLLIILSILSVAIFIDCSSNRVRDDDQWSLSNSPQTIVRPDFCTLEPDAGNCKMGLERYFYNATSRNCESFLYGGCDGNRNNFKFKYQCSRTCKNRVSSSSSSSSSSSEELKRPNYCNLRPERGPCEAHIMRYYYNHARQTCEMFYYGGCQGNKNNFISKIRCLRECKV